MKRKIIIGIICVFSSLLMCLANIPQSPFDINLQPDATSSIKVFLPPTAKAGQPVKAVIICPGGGYSRLAIGHEGNDWGVFFNELGIAAIVLKYRIPKGDLSLPTTDALNAIRTVKKHAAEWNINPNDIGIMGSSAGGHLASTIATHAPQELRPAFQILFYPVITMNPQETHNGSRKNFLGENPTAEMERLYSNELQVTENTPQAFITLSDNDKTVRPINAIKYYMALQEKGIPASLHIYPSGNHGWGIKPSFRYKDEMLAELRKWLSGNPVHVLITAGQSNTDGRVSNRLLPYRIRQMAKDTINYLSGKYKYCRMAQNRVDGQFAPYWPLDKNKDPKWAYDAVVYYMMEKAVQEEFYVIKWAVGGTSIACPNDTAKGAFWSANPKWLSKTTSTEKGGNSLLLSFTESIDACIDQTLSKIKRGYQIDAFLWHQGESDYKRGKEYYDNLKAVVAYVRTHLSGKTGKDYSKLPFIFGSIPKNSRQYNADVETAMKRLAEEDSNILLVDMSNGELQDDQVHFNEKSAEYLGKQMFEHLRTNLKLND